MYFPLILAALVIASAVFLLRQYITGDLSSAGDADAPELLASHRDDDRPDVLKAA